jgi:hypothetical protein
MIQRVALVRTDVSEEILAFIIGATKIVYSYKSQTT